MGLSVKLSKKDPNSWPLFLTRAAEILSEGRALGTPVGKGNYGIMGDPTNINYIQWFTTNIGAISGDSFIFLGQSQDIFKDILKPYPIAIKIAQKVWPGNVILSIPLTKKVFTDTAVLSPFFQNISHIPDVSPPDYINLLVSDIPQMEAFFAVIAETSATPLIAGSSVGLLYNEIAADIRQFSEILDPNLFAMILDCGKLQKKQVKTNTIITIDGPEEFSITREGLDSQKVHMFIGDDENETI